MHLTRESSTRSTAVASERPMGLMPVGGGTTPAHGAARAHDFLSLTKPRVLLLVLIATGLGYVMAAASLDSYLLLFTPLNRRSHLCTLVGACPGAAPVLMGWAAVRGDLTPEAWVLYAILFLWQFPHFLAIGWLYREDYARAGMRMIPAGDWSGRATC